MTAFLVGHYARHFSRLVALFLGGNVPTNCYLICYLLYDSSSSSNAVLNCLSPHRPLLPLFTSYSPAGATGFGLLLPMVALNGSLAREPFRFVHRRHCLMVGHHQALVVFSSSGRPFCSTENGSAWRCTAELLMESRTPNAGHFGIIVPWFAIMYTVDICKFKNA
ncbi:hypothetical protein TYRP_021738 [Tyrophagus putrescentiae]|nr:hypothetical protein TYRP_021738 [Tyrophagus putrescentiae]